MGKEGRYKGEEKLASQFASRLILKVVANRNQVVSTCSAQILEERSSVGILKHVGQLLECLFLICTVHMVTAASTVGGTCAAAEATLAVLACLFWSM